MSNPVLNESTFEKLRDRHAGEPGWGAANPSSTQGNSSQGNTWAPPITDGPVSTYHSGVMTVSGAASASLLLFAVLLISAAVGWVAVAEPEPGVLAFPAMALVGAVVGEYLGSAAGLGYVIHEAEGTFDVTGVFAGMVVLAVFVLAIDGVVTLVERRLLAWRPPASGA